MSKAIEDQILSYIKEKKVVRTKDIEKKFNLTQSTARRNLINLEKNNLITRRFGENFLKENKIFSDDFVTKRFDKNVKVKKAIAKKAAKLTYGYKTIYVDSGSLCFYLLDYLDKNITIFTNSLLNAQKAITLGFTNINLLGGMLKEKTYSIVNIDDEILEKINFPISFMGTNAIDQMGNLYTPEKREAITKMKILKRSLFSVVLAEKEKFGIKSTFNFNPNIDRKIIVVTDSKNQKIKNENFVIISI